jgi:hypothetical protein
LASYEQIEKIAYPIALCLWFIVQKYDAMKVKANLAAQDAAAAERKRATEATALELKRTTEREAQAVKDKLEEQNRHAEQVAATVKRDLEVSNHKTGLKMEEIHVDVNSKMLAAKKRIWELALVIASMRPDSPEDASAARAAHKDYLDQLAAQERADERLRLFAFQGQGSESRL